MNDKQIRLYKRACNSGNIGNVKNEAISLCRGKYVLEMDHDDEILPDCLYDANQVFDNDSTIGFVYMDFINIYENATKKKITKKIISIFNSLNSKILPRGTIYFVKDRAYHPQCWSF